MAYMPIAGAKQREDKVLETVCVALSASGRRLEIVDRPDRRPPGDRPPVDALIRVVMADSYDCVWAADVCLASKKFDPRIPAATKELQKALTPQITAVARAANRRVTVLCRAYLRPEKVSGREWRILMREYHQNIFDRAVMALMRPNGEWTDAEVSILWRGAPENDNEDLVRMSYNDPFIHEGFSFSPTVRKKLQGQLRLAREAGYPTMLILDQQPPSYMPWIGNIMPTPYEIGEGIAFAVASVRAKLDACILVEHEDRVHEVYGKVGEPESPSC